MYTKTNVHKNFGVRSHFWHMKTTKTHYVLCACVWAYVLMYVKRLVFVYVCEGFSYLCVSVKPALFVYIREPFAFWPTLAEDFGFDVMFLLM